MKIRERFGRPIEPRILPLVESLNVPGVCETIASCEGHRNWLTGVMRPAYVYFKSTIRFASELNARVYGDSCLDQPRLRHYWHLRGMFDGENNLAFSLSIPDYDGVIPLTLLDASCLRLWRRWSREALDTDFEILREFVSAALAQLRQDPVPKIDQGQAGQAYQHCRHEHFSHPLFGAWPDTACGLGCAAVGTNVGIPTDLPIAIPACNQISHRVLPCSRSLGCAGEFATGAPRP